MPTYKATDPSSGKSVSLTGDSPPTEQELNDVFSQVHGQDQRAQAPNTGGFINKTKDFLGQSIGPQSDILSNRPTGLLGSVARAMPGATGAIAGAGAGAAAGVPLGPWGMLAGGLAGAYVGGSAGEAARQAAVQANNAYTGQSFTPPGEVLQRVNQEGLTNAAAEGGSRILGGIGRLPAGTAPGRTIADEVAKAGGQVIKVLTNADARSGEFMLRHPGTFSEAQSLEQAGQGFSKYMENAGITNGPSGAKIYGGQRILGREAKFSLADEALNDISKWQEGGMTRGIDPQTGGEAIVSKSGFTPDVNKLLVAREQLAKLTETPAMRNEAAKSELRTIYEDINKLDNAIETLQPGYRGQRADYRAASVSDAFSNPVPMNKHGQPNGLLPFAAAAAMGGGAAFLHNPALLAAAPLFSPLTYGLATKAVYRVVNSGAGRVGAVSLADAYMNGSQPR